MIFITSKISDGNMQLLKNRERFFKKLGIKNVIGVKQIHGNRVVFVDKVMDPEIIADGMITNNSGINLMLKVADCIPIGLYDPIHQAIGLIHAGYKGLEKGIIKNAIQAMKKNYKTNPKDLIVQFGPSIGPCHYWMDIWTEAEKQLENYAVLKENIDNPRICTYESSDYFSHRRSEDKNQPEGRFVTILGLNHAN